MRITIFVLLVFCSISLRAQEYFNAFESPRIEILNAIVSDLELKRGTAKIAIPVTVPKDCEGWFYSITILPRTKGVAEEPELLEKVQVLSEQYDPQMIGEYLEVDQTGRTANVYLINGKEEADEFVNFQAFRSVENFIGTKSFTGYVKHKKRKSYFIGIENPYEVKGLKVKVEVVGVR
jgi:hypothetical protein